MDFTINKPEKLIKAIIHTVQGMSFGSAQKAIRLGKIKVNNKRVKDNVNLSVGDIVSVYEFNKSKPTVPIIYEDDNIIIVNKPQGIECATRDKSLNNTYSLEEILEEHSAIVVHRLDRLTEGIVVLAKSKEIATKFEKIFRTREIDKFYQAAVVGVPKNTGVLKAYLKKNANSALVDISNEEKPNYKEIITEIDILEDYKQYSILDIKLHTGRTHQIRAHMAHLGHHIIGDNKYGSNSNILENNNYKGYYLTAYKIVFNITDKQLEYLNNLNIEIQPTWKTNIKN